MKSVDADMTSQIVVNAIAEVYVASVAPSVLYAYQKSYNYCCSLNGIRALIVAITVSRLVVDACAI